MRTQSLDTSPEFERVQIAHIRALSAARKFKSVRSWTQSITSANFYAMHGSTNGIDEIQESDRAAQFIAREYGDNLATLFRDEVVRRADWTRQTPDLQEAILPAIEAYEKLGIRYVLTGSVACSIYGLPRAAQDVDMLAEFHSEQIAALFEHFSHTYLFDQNAISLAIQQRTSFNLLHISRLVKIDVFLSSGSFEEAILQRGQAVPLIEGRVPLKLASPEDIALTRLIWYRQNGNNADDQWNDILGLLKVQAPRLDLAYLSQQAETLKVHDLLAQAIDDAGICEI